MEVITAKSAGFCYGVERAVNLAFETINGCPSCKMLGQIIHNQHVISELSSQGLVIVESMYDIQNNDTVIIRSHGEQKEVIDYLQSKEVQIISATCPNVQRIQQIISKTNDNQRIPVIIGEKKHPEVIGLASWNKNSVILSDLKDATLWTSTIKDKNIPITVVSQTTAIRGTFLSICDFLKKEYTNIEIFDTICNATQKRQQEATKLSKAVDAMVIIGDSMSANTRHLAEICRLSCSYVYLINDINDLDMDWFKDAKRIGITAGASTPASIIEEVETKMSDVVKATEATEESFAELLEQNFKTLKTGEKATGIVTAIGPTEIQVDLGCKQSGYIAIEELSADPTVKPEDIVKVGDEIEAYIIRVNDVDGYAMLSKKRLDAVKVWDDLAVAVENRDVLEGKVTEENKGGVVVNVKGVRVFVPASQTGLPRGAELKDLIGTTTSLRLTEVNRARRRVVGNIRSVSNEARQAAQAEIWSNIEIGKHYEGVVKSMTTYGVFVDIGGVDGMVHISELSWSRIKNPAEVCAVGDKLDVYVISFDAEKRKISLGVKDHAKNPWNLFMDSNKIGDVVNVRIVKLMQYGAFAEIIPGVDGLIHISQVSNHHVEKPSDELKEGQSVDAKIIAVDEEKMKVSLSIRALLTPAETEVSEETSEEN